MLRQTSIPCPECGLTRRVRMSLPVGYKFKTERDVDIHDEIHEAVGGPETRCGMFDARDITVSVGNEVCMRTTAAVRGAWETEDVVRRMAAAGGSSAVFEPAEEEENEERFKYATCNATGNAIRAFDVHKLATDVSGIPKGHPWGHSASDLDVALVFNLILFVHALHGDTIRRRSKSAREALRKDTFAFLQALRQLAGPRFRAGVDALVSVIVGSAVGALEFDGRFEITRKRKKDDFLRTIEWATAQEGEKSKFEVELGDLIDLVFGEFGHDASHYGSLVANALRAASEAGVALARRQY